MNTYKWWKNEGMKKWLQVEENYYSECNQSLSFLVLVMRKKSPFGSHRNKKRFRRPSKTPFVSGEVI